MLIVGVKASTSKDDDIDLDSGGSILIKYCNNNFYEVPNTCKM